MRTCSDSSTRSLTRGDLQVHVSERVPLNELAALHARAEADAVSGKAIVVDSQPAEIPSTNSAFEEKESGQGTYDPASGLVS